VGRKIATLLAALSMIAAVPAAAQAQDEIYLEVWPPALTVNAKVNVSLVGCRTPTVATSSGFVSPVRLESAGNNVEGTVNVVGEAGGYTATAECAGKPYSVQFVVQDLGEISFGVTQLVEPGGEIYAKVIRNQCSIIGQITSPGFTKPIYPITQQYWHEGTTTAIATPGTYTATVHCEGKPEPFTTLFTIKGTPPTSTSTPPPATTTTPPAAKPAPKAPVVKPKGAPQTGGGGTA